MSDLFTGLITSKTRIRLIVRLFFNTQTRSYLRELARELNISSNAVREELNQLRAARLLNTSKSGRNVYYRANPDHPLFPELKSMVNKTIGMDRVIDGIVARLGDVEAAYLMDDYAEGKDTGIIDLLLIGNINRVHLDDLSRKTERYINRKIRTMAMTRQEFKSFEGNFKHRPSLLIWKSEKKGSSGKSE
ncbi:MAG: winged helix-turn-helix domain-containing protein [Desulfobacterales bacterium]|nr:winged helix-turn-helix domain-containing protein [Desulfobacterales bacterium]